MQDNRRSVLVKFVTGGLGAIAAALAGLVGLVAAPVKSGPARRWRRAISVFDVPPDEPIVAVLAERRPDGWYESRRETVVYIDRDGDGYRALSATCSHLGCRVRWDPPTTQFRCPCHGGIYDRAGAVVAGPPPLPLSRLPVRVNPETSEIEVEL